MCVSLSLSLFFILFFSFNSMHWSWTARTTKKLIHLIYVRTVIIPERNRHPDVGEPKMKNWSWTKSRATNYGWLSLLCSGVYCVLLIYCTIITIIEFVVSMPTGFSLFSDVCSLYIFHFRKIQHKFLISSFSLRTVLCSIGLHIVCCVSTRYNMRQMMKWTILRCGYLFRN